jgi:hypothetical protein
MRDGAEAELRWVGQQQRMEGYCGRAPAAATSPAAEPELEADATHDAGLAAPSWVDRRGVKSRRPPTQVRAEASEAANVAA